MLPEVGITFRGKGVLEPMQVADGESMDPEPVVRRRGGRGWSSGNGIPLAEIVAEATYPEPGISISSPTIQRFARRLEE